MQHKSVFGLKMFNIECKMIFKTAVCPKTETLFQLLPPTLN